MPILTLPSSPFGPIVDLAIGISDARAVILRSMTPSAPIPAPIQLRPLIDTGAAVTCVSAGVLAPLGLTPTGTVTLSTASHSAQYNQFDVNLTLLHPTLSLVFRNVAMTECGMVNTSYQALLGRDILAACILIYDGPAKRFSLSF